MFEAERFDSKLRRQLQGLDDRFDRQFHLLCWFFEQYARFIPRDHVIFYENIVKSGGRALSAVTKRAQELNEPLVPKNNNPLYNQHLKLALGEKLLELEGTVWEFYSKSSVEDLLLV